MFDLFYGCDKDEGTGIEGQHTYSIYIYMYVYIYIYESLVFIPSDVDGFRDGTLWMYVLLFFIHRELS